MRTNQRTDGDDWTITTSVGRTALLVAFGRAIETRREDALIDDPFAEHLVRAAGEDDLTPEAMLAEAQDDPALARTVAFAGDMMAARTRWIDDEIRRVNADRCRQVVLLASGLDARAVRIPWAPGTTVFEVDRPSVLEFKEKVLRSVDARSSARHVRVARDLREDWLGALRDEGLAEDVPTFWLAEGLLPYLRAEHQERLLSTISSTCVSGSVLQFDTPGGLHDTSAFDEDAERFGVAIDELFLDTGEFDAQSWLDENGWATSSLGIREVLQQHGRTPELEARYEDMIGALRLVTAHRR